MDYINRSEWGARPAESFTSSDPGRLLGVTVHWYGSPSAVVREADFEAQLRAVQRAHQMGEFNDIAYNFVVSPWGKVYEGRGFRRQTGANGTTYANQNYAAVCVAIGTGNTPSAAARAAVARVIAAYRALGTGRDVKPHGYWTGSTCPGPDLRAWIAAGGYEATPTPTPSPTKEDDPNVYPWLNDWLRWLFHGRNEGAPRPANVPASIPADALAVAGSIESIVKLTGPPRIFQEWRDGRILGDPTPEGVPLPVPKRWWAGATRDHAFANRYAERMVAAVSAEKAVVVANLQKQIDALEAAIASGDVAGETRDARLRALLEEALAVMAA